MKYHYLILKTEPDALETELNKFSPSGWKLFNIQYVNEVAGIAINGQPKLVTKCIAVLEKPEITP